jgi:hypothetical protein
MSSGTCQDETNEAWISTRFRSRTTRKVKERVKAKAKTEEKVNDSSRRKGKRKALVLLMKQLVRKDLSPLRPLVIS